MHITHIEAIKAAAEASWGVERNGKTRKEALAAAFKAMVEKGGIDVSSAALLAILAEINRFIKALRKGDDDPDFYSKTPPEKDDETKRFPNAKVGDVLYCCDELEQGVRCRIVIECEEDGCVLVVSEGKPRTHQAWVNYAGDEDFLTEAEALAHGATTDIEYHGPRLELARRVLEAVNSGADLSEFREGVNTSSEEASED